MLSEQGLKLLVGKHTIENPLAVTKQYVTALKQKKCVFWNDEFINTRAKYLCELLDVDEEYYYKVVKRLELNKPFLERKSTQEQYFHANLITLMACIYEQKGRKIGANRMYTELKNHLNVEFYKGKFAFSKSTVSRYMRKYGMICAVRIKRTVHSVGKVIRARIVRRGEGFSTLIPNQIWCGDITVINACLPDNKGGHVRTKLYLAMFIDLYDNSIVGWAVGQNQTTELVLQALQNAYDNNPGFSPIVHTDCGSQFTNEQFISFVEARGGITTNSQPGKCIQNGLIESTFGIVKDLIITGKKPKLHPEMENLLKDVERLNIKSVNKYSDIRSVEQYREIIHSFVVNYNMNMAQSTLDGITPMMFRAKFYANGEAKPVNLVVPHQPNGQGVIATVDLSKESPLNGVDLTQSIVDPESFSKALLDYYNCTERKATKSEVEALTQEQIELRKAIYEALPEDVRCKSAKKFTQELVSHVRMTTDQEYLQIAQVQSLLNLGITLDLKVVKFSDTTFLNLKRTLGLTEEMMKKHNITDTGSLLFFMRNTHEGSELTSRVTKEKRIKYSLSEYAKIQFEQYVELRARAQAVQIAVG